jgi:predicted NBD/HSP70 family sugar kinase
MAKALRIVRNHAGIGQQNRMAIIKALSADGPMPRTDLAERVGLTDASVSRITRDLIRTGFLEETTAPPPTGRPGRPGINLQIRGDGGFVIGIGINAYEQSAVLWNLSHRKLAQCALGQMGRHSHAADCDRIARRIETMLANAGVDRRRILGIGVACAGAVDPHAGVVTASATVNWFDIPVAAMLNERLDLPCSVEGTTNAILTAEFQAGRIPRNKDAVALTAALGFGGGMLFNGQLLRGRDFMAGQISQIAVTDRRGADGKPLTLDEIGAGRGVLARLGEPMSPEPGGDYDPAFAAARLLDVIARARAGDQRLKTAFAETGYECGRILSPVTTALSPDLILIGGPVSEVPEYAAAIGRAITDLGPTERGPEILHTAMSNADAGAHHAVGVHFLDHGFETEELTAFERSA